MKSALKKKQIVVNAERKTHSLLWEVLNCKICTFHIAHTLLNYSSRQPSVLIYLE